VILKSDKYKTMIYFVASKWW